MSWVIRRKSYVKGYPPSFVGKMVLPGQQVPLELDKLTPFWTRAEAEERLTVIRLRMTWSPEERVQVLTMEEAERELIQWQIQH